MYLTNLVWLFFPLCRSREPLLLSFHGTRYYFPCPPYHNYKSPVDLKYRALQLYNIYVYMPVHTQVTYWQQYPQAVDSRMSDSGDMLLLSELLSTHVRMFPALL